MKVEISKTAVIICENEYEIRLLQESLQNAITHAGFDPKEMKIISDLERYLTQ